MELKTVFELKTLAKERGMCGYSRLTKRELVQLLQSVEPMHLLQTEDLTCLLFYNNFFNSKHFLGCLLQLLFVETTIYLFTV